MQTDWFRLIIHDLKSLILSIELKDLTYASYLVLWGVILFYPLHRVDRADPIAGLMYVFYSVAAGATVFFALPKIFTEPGDVGVHCAVLASMALISSYRWFRLEDKQEILIKEANKSLEKDGP